MLSIVCLLSLIALCFFSLSQRGKVLYSWDNASFEGQDYRFKIVAVKEKTKKLFVGIESTFNVNFLIKNETWIDKASKLFGISVEFQFDDDLFDKKFYIVSGNKDVYATIKNSVELRKKLLELINVLEYLKLDFRKISSSKQGLWVETKPLINLSSGLPVGIAEKLIPKIVEINQILVDAMKPSKEVNFETYLGTSSVMQSITSGLFLNGGISILMFLWFDDFFVIDTYELVKISIGFGLFLALSFAFVVFRSIGRTAWAHLYLFPVVFGGLLGGAMSFFVIVREVNMDLDYSPREHYTVSVLKKYHSGSRRYKTYTLVVKDWLGAKEKRSVDVSYDIYQQAFIDNPITIVQKPGFFGFRWVESVYPY